jgi:hypothetical protein
VGVTVLKAGLASLGLAAGALAGLWAVQALGLSGGIVGEVLAVVVPGGLGMAAYAGLIGLLGVPEAQALAGVVRNRLRLRGQET